MNIIHKLIAILVCSFGASQGFSQILAGHVGSFDLYVAGTTGTHRGNLLNGTVTISSTGVINGSLRNWDRSGAVETIRGTISLATGRGRLTVGSDRIDVIVRSKSTIVATGTYTKVGTSSGGKIGAIR